MGKVDWGRIRMTGMFGGVLQAVRKYEVVVLIGAGKFFFFFSKTHYQLSHSISPFLTPNTPTTHNTTIKKGVGATPFASILKDMWLHARQEIDETCYRKQKTRSKSSFNVQKNQKGTLDFRFMVSIDVNIIYGFYKYYLWFL